MSRHNFGTLVLAVVLGIGAGPLPGSASATTNAVTSSQRELTEWAIGRFSSAGLQLPAVRVLFLDSPEGCGGNSGSFNPSLGQVNLCAEESFVLLHELAHVWMNAHLTEEARSSYVEEGGFESWNNRLTPWSPRGSEDAADTLAWGLLEQPISSWTPDGPLEKRNIAFRMLTGSDSPRMITSDTGTGSPGTSTRNPAMT